MLYYNYGNTWFNRYEWASIGIHLGNSQMRNTWNEKSNMLKAS